MNDFDYSEYSDHELVNAWNYLETCILSDYVEKKMDAIMRECQSRKIISWNKNGEEIKYDN